jgi:hypothetical protein
MLKARLDPALEVRIVGWRDLRYSEPQRLGDDRPPHVRAASGLAFTGGRLAVIQDDVAFIAMVGGNDVSAVVLPRGEGGRRRFEVELGNKHEKLDLEACVAIGDDLFAFGSGSTAARERVVHVGYGTRVLDASPLYRRLREEIGGDINIEGVAIVHGEGRARTEPAAGSHDAAYSGALALWPGVQDESSSELWFFHRGNTGPADRGPAIVRFCKPSLLRWLLGNGPVPQAIGSAHFDLGTVEGVRFGFTDAVGRGEQVFYIAAAEDTPNAIDDGRILGSQIGVIGGGGVRCASLAVDGAPVKAEGLAFDPADPTHAWIVIDPDDVGTPARLYEVALAGRW